MKKTSLLVFILFMLGLFSPVRFAIAAGSSSDPRFLQTCFARLKDLVLKRKTAATADQVNPHTNWITEFLDPSIPKERSEILVDVASAERFPNVTESQLLKELKDAETAVQNPLVLGSYLPNRLSPADFLIAKRSQVLASRSIPHRIVFENPAARKTPAIVILPDEKTDYGRAAKRVAAELPGAVLTVGHKSHAYLMPKASRPPWIREDEREGPWPHAIRVTGTELTEAELAIVLDHEIGHGKTVSDLAAGVPGHHYGRVSRSRGGGYSRDVANDELYLTARTLTQYVDDALAELPRLENAFAGSFNGAMQRLHSAMAFQLPPPPEQYGSVTVLDLPGDVAQLVVNLESVSASLHGAYDPIGKMGKGIDVSGPISERALHWFQVSYFKDKSGRTRVFVPIHESWGHQTKEQQRNHIGSTAKAMTDDSFKIHQWLNSTQAEVEKLSGVERREKLRVFLLCLKRLEDLDRISPDPTELESQLKAAIQEFAPQKAD